LFGCLDPDDESRQGSVRIEAAARPAKQARSANRGFLPASKAQVALFFVCGSGLSNLSHR